MAQLARSQGPARFRHRSYQGFALLATSLAAWAVGCTLGDANNNPSGGGGTAPGAAGSSGCTEVCSSGQTSASGATTAGATASGAATGGAVTAGTSTGGSANNGSCGLTNERVRITEVDVGGTVVNDEDEAALNPLSISPVPAGGARVGWKGSDGKVHVTSLDASDQVTGAAAAFAASDFEDIYADDAGGVLLVTRDAQGGGTLNCGDPTNLCGTPPSPAVPCYDMYLVRFDGTTETWATKLTDSSAALPPYSTGKTGANVVMIWWYAHHGQIAFDGANYAAYYGAAISVTQSGCINIHQGDRMDVVSKAGALGKGFNWGCSHSGYEHIIWDPGAKKFVTVCQNDAPTSGQSGRLAYAPMTSTMYPVDLWYSNVSELELAKGGGYWTMTSTAQSGQPANADGLADVHLLHFDGALPSQDIVVANDAAANERAPHLAGYGADHLIAGWESSTAKGNLSRNDGSRKLSLRTLDRATGAAIGDAVTVNVKGNRYQEMVPFPDGSVAFVAPGSSATKLKILRVLPCAG